MVITQKRRKMKIKLYKKLSVVLLATVVTFSNVASVFAANDYGINYTGGSELQNNVTIDPNIENGLKPMIYVGGSTTHYGAEWKNGYFKLDDVCSPVKYLYINSKSKTYNNLGYISENRTEDGFQQYSVQVDIKKISLEKDTPASFAVGVRDSYNSIFGGITIYDEGCHNVIENTDTALRGNNSIYVETSMKILKNNQPITFGDDNLYFSVTDIDAGQSFKILNSGNMFSPSNMYAKSAADLQGQDSPWKNMFNTNYIYSQYGTNGGESLDTPDISDVFVKLNKNTQDEGLKMVFGYGLTAASGIRYLAKVYNVYYESDENGAIGGTPGITNESVVSGDTPTGSSQIPNNNYVFTYWTANKNVRLKDGTTIPAGGQLTDEQVKEVVVESDITFTAHHATRFVVKYESDDYGEITGIDNENVDPYNHPSGSEQSPDEGYIFSHWIADKDVTLEDSTLIKAGDPILTDQIKQVIVDQDITFTAIHVTKGTPVLTPNTGVTSKGIDAAQIVSVSVLGVILIGLFAKYLPRFMRKKVKFDR